MTFGVWWELTNSLRVFIFLLQIARESESLICWHDGHRDSFNRHASKMGRNDNELHKALLRRNQIPSNAPASKTGVCLFFSCNLDQFWKNSIPTPKVCCFEGKLMEKCST